MKVLRKLLACIVAAAFTTCTGLADPIYSDWDIDNDDRLDRNKFESTYGDAYERWDRDGDNYLDDDEIAEGMSNFSD